MSEILVTGATGNVGRAVVAALRSRGLGVRAAATSVAGVHRVLGDEVDAVALDLRRRGSWSAALAGCRALFLLRPPAIADAKGVVNPFVDAARANGVAQIVFLSVAGADRNPLLPHYAIERHLQAADDRWTILRPGFFAQNLGDAYLRDIRDDDRLYVPAGRGRAAFVDVRDVGEVAAQTLLEPRAHRGRAYLLTGPRAESFDDAARLLSTALGRRIRYEPASIVGYARHLHRQGLPLGQIAVQTLLHLGLRLGQAARVDPTLAQLLGRAPRSLADYVRDHAALFGPASAAGARD